MTQVVLVCIGLIAVAIVLGLATINRLICICQPNEVLIFSGRGRNILRLVEHREARPGQREAPSHKKIGYRVVIGGRKMRIPLLERVDRMDLTNMIIDVAAHNAYSKGGIPLSVQGVANIKIAGEEPVLNNAIERFLGRSRADIMRIAKATLEGALRGVLATMTPEQVNEDRLLFGQKLVGEAEKDMTNLGLVVDTLKIQNVSDDVSYLDSIGRKSNALIRRHARIAEAIAKAQSITRAAENRETEARAQIEAQIAIAKADAQKRLTDAVTRRDAVVAEERATVAAAVAQANGEVSVQTARIEQTRRRLEADIVEPAKAYSAAANAAARANAAPTIEDGKARADALRSMALSWQKAGDNARNVFLLQKLQNVIDILTDTIGETNVENVTMIDAGVPTLGGNGAAAKALSTLEQVKQVFGVDLVEKLNLTKDGGRPQLPG